MGVRIAAGVIVAVAYAASFALHHQLLPGLVGGALCGILVYLLLTRAEQARRRR